MHYTQLRPDQVAILYADSGINHEFARKVQELDRRLQMNGMNYRNWDSLTDRQQSIFSDDLFLKPTCASSVENYVDGAVESCGCEDTEEELHHHSPSLMKLINLHMADNKPVTLKIENHTELDTQIENILETLLESEDN